jgi:hypothetical protein
MCDFCFIQELKFTLYTMHDRECTRLWGNITDQWNV